MRPGLCPGRNRSPGRDRLQRKDPARTPGPTPGPTPGLTPGPAPGRGPGAGRGAVTAEFAVALPAVLLVLGLLLAGSAAGLAQLRLEEAARAGARALARGEDDAAVTAIVRRLAGDSARTAVASEAGWLSVTVSGTVHGAVAPLVPWTLTARAWARSESADPPALSVPRSAPWRLDRRA